MLTTIVKNGVGESNTTNFSIAALTKRKEQKSVPVRRKLHLNNNQKKNEEKAEIY